jgi:fermentation-respiration switch protein FrsA (DUF1100 family)
VKTTGAPANAWEIRMNWGDRALEAEVVDGRGRKTLSLGERPEDDFVIGGGARLHFTWTEAGLEVTFSTGIAGTAALKGDAPVPLGHLVERGVVKEAASVFSMTLSGTDALMLQVSGQSIEVRQARGRIARLRIDVWATTALVTALFLLALWLASTILPMQGLNLIPK